MLQIRPVVLDRPLTRKHHSLRELLEIRGHHLNTHLMQEIRIGKGG
jgi:hypothetical protein